MKRSKKNYFLLWICWSKLVFICKSHPRNPPDFNGINSDTRPILKLLEVFGLERNLTEHREHPMPPQYMLDLYRAFAARHASKLKSHYHNANTVRSFFDKGRSNHNYHFDVENNIFTHEEVILAEFHIFCNSHSISNQLTSHITQILLYEDRNNSRNLLESRIINSHSPGWEVFRVTSTVKKWLQIPGSNIGFVIEILDLSQNEWVLRRISQVYQVHKRPILIVFSYDRRRAKSNSSIGDSNSQTIRNPLQNEPHIEKALTGARSTRSASVEQTGQCARHELRVDFEKLGWSSWIISPKWYDAYICSGTCAFPLGQNQRPSNHATVQSIVHELGLIAGVKAPCCVPTDLQSVSLLYFDEHTNVVLKQYEEMVATGCGCQ